MVYAEKGERNVRLGLKGEYRRGGYISMTVNSAVLTRDAIWRLRLVSVPLLPVPAKAGQRSTLAPSGS
jgi:hypothetical protein